MSKSILLIGLLVLFWGVAVADATQLGRITSQVNFRKGPSTSAPIIRLLQAGTEVEVVKRNPAGWYFVVHRGRPGFVHRHYVKVYQDQSSDDWWESKYMQLARPAGMVLAGIGIILMASALMPTLLRTATALVIALVAVVVSDLLFQLGMLYSLFCVSFGVFVIVLLFRKRRDQFTSADQISPKKAA